MEYIKKGLKIGSEVEKWIKSEEDKRSVLIKDKLMGEMGSPIGWHTVGAPLALSAMFMLLAFTMPQLVLWHAIFSFLFLPEHAVFTGIILSGLVFCTIMMLSLVYVARGYVLALRLYMAMSVFTLMLSSGYAIFTVMACFFHEGWHLAYIISSVSGLSFIAVSIRFINSQMFYKMLAYYLHNRVWRILLH